MRLGRLDATLFQSIPFLRPRVPAKCGSRCLFGTASAQAGEAPDLCSWCRSDMTPHRWCANSEANHAGPSDRERARRADCVSDLQSLSCQFCPVTARHSICPSCARALGQGILGAHFCPLCFESDRVHLILSANLDDINHCHVLAWYIPRLCEKGDTGQAISVVKRAWALTEAGQPAQAPRAAWEAWLDLLEHLWDCTRTAAGRAQEFLAARCRGELGDYRLRHKSTSGIKRISDVELLRRLHLSGHWGDLNLQDQRVLSQTYSAVLTSSGICPVDLHESPCLVRLSQTVSRWLPEEYAALSTYLSIEFDPFVYWRQQWRLN